MQTGPILDCGAPGDPRSVAWLGAHKGAISAVDGEATLAFALRDAAYATANKAEEPEAPRKKRLFTGGGDWAVCRWELEGP
jgi:hypothetical protein